MSDLFGSQWTNIDDGSNTTFFDWGSGEPNNSSNHNRCVYMDMSGYWYTDDCSHDYPYVCGVNETNVLSTTVISSTTTSTTAQLPSTVITTQLASTAAVTTPSTMITQATSTAPSGQTTPSTIPAYTCKSYIPFSYDVSQKLTSDQFSALKTFILNPFLQPVFPMDLQPAPFSTYSMQYFPLRRLQNVTNIISYVTVEGNQVQDTTSDFTQ